MNIECNWLPLCVRAFRWLLTSDWAAILARSWNLRLTNRDCGRTCFLNAYGLPSPRYDITRQLPQRRVDKRAPTLGQMNGSHTQTFSALTHQNSSHLVHCAKGTKPKLSGDRWLIRYLPKWIHQTVIPVRHDSLIQTHIIATVTFPPEATLLLAFVGYLGN